MNLTKIKEVGKWMMVVGASVFTCGVGINLTCNHLERKDAKKEHDLAMMKIEEEGLSEKLKLDEMAIKAKTEKDKLYAEKLKTMDEKAFAEFHADRIARANEDVIANAERIKKDAESEVLKIRMSCNDEMDRLRTECIRKIEEANKKRDEAISKYEAIDNLFTNKKEILKAKEALESTIRRDQEIKDNKEELLKSIKDMLN